MTPQKTLTPAEALMALSAGRKITKPNWLNDEFISLSACGSIKNQNGCFAIFGGDYILYTEPKPKRKVAPYVVKFTKSKHLEMTFEFFENEIDLCAEYASPFSIIRRVTELEVEIED